MNNALQFNHLLHKVEPSKSVTLLAKAKQLQKVDSTVLNLTAGEPDFDTPKPIIEEIYKQLIHGNTHYIDSKGDLELRQAIAKKLKKDNNISYSKNQILITPGAKYAIYIAIQALINEDDEVLWLSPGWVSYPAIVTLCSGTPVAVPLNYEQDYAISYEQLEAKTTEKTKLLIINYPNNPTGKVLSKKDMDELKKYLRKHPNMYVISDEIYEKIIFDQNVHYSLAADPEFYERTVTINGFSKSAAMTGFRIGYLACAPTIYAAILKVFQHSISCTSGFIQKGAIVALGLETEIENMRQTYEYRRNLIYSGLKDIPNIECKLPEGTFYAWIKFNTKLSSEELCNKLLEELKIVGVPGNAYGEEEHCMIRFCFATDQQTIEEFISRIQHYFRKEENHE